MHNLKQINPYLLTVGRFKAAFALLAIVASTFTSSGQTLRAYYPFDGNFQDASGNGHNGTANGSVLTTDRNGNENSACYFNGTNATMEIGTGVKPSFPFTIVAWVNGSGGLISNDSWGTYYYGFHVNWSLTTPQIAFGDGGFSASYSRRERSPLGFGGVAPGWHHLAIVAYSVTDTRWYIDGVYYDDQAGGNGTATSMAYSGGSGRVGRNAASAQYFNGSVDELRVYNGALSQSQITDLPEYDKAPKITSQPKSLQVTNGAHAEFSVGAFAMATIDYQWYRIVSGTPQLLPGETDSTLVIDPAISFFEGQYMVGASNFWGVATSAPVRLHVSEIIPDVADLLTVRFPTSHGKQYSVLTNHVLAAGGGWEAATSQLPGNGQVVGANIKPEGPAEFFKVAETNGTIAPGGACVVSNNPTVQFVTEPANQTVPNGGTAIFSASVNADEPVSFRWWGPGGPLSDDPTYLSGSGTCTLKIENVFNLFSGDYWVVVSNPVSTNTSQAATLSVAEFRASQSIGSKIYFPTTVGRSYQVDYSTNLDTDVWLTWGSPLVATETETVLDYTNASPENVNFRVRDVTP